jgi:ribosomal-protein-alanine N-acetyltransferase
MKSPNPVPLNAADASGIAALEKSCFPQPWSENQYRRGLLGNALRVLGIKEDRELLGYVSYYLVDSQAEIVNLAIVRSRRRQGLGRTLLAAMLQECREAGIMYIFLEVRRTNHAAIGLYAGSGFRRAGIRKGYYPDTGEDALVMVLDLKTGSPEEF